MNRTLSAAAVLVAIGAITTAAACTDTSSIGALGEGGGGASSTGTAGGAAATVKVADKIDIVLAIDNSSSMADKQAVMSLALTDLVQSFTNPPCFDAAGSIVASPPVGGDCPSGSSRGYAAVNDIHLGVISSSLGSLGGDFCTPSDPGHPDDAGHLITRGGPTGTVDTYQGQGFLAWDPDGAMNPPGDSDFTAFTSKALGLIAGAGQDGCGFEAELESWYRFLADPEPPTSVRKVSEYLFKPEGLDQDVLAQRANFLRPDSLLVVIQLADEDDCSIMEDSSYPILMSQQQMPKATAVCATNPNDPCCGSCIDPPPNCPVDPTCDGGLAQLDAHDDQPNTRCFDQKRRFGLDFLYSTDRYVGALTNPTVTLRDGTQAPNPVFSTLRPEDAGKPVRDPSLVAFVGLVGVPWQDVAKDASDPTQGLSSPDELAAANVDGHSRWDIMLGDPSTNTPAYDPFMIPSIDPRSGSNPITGTPILPPDSTTLNAINGHEWDTQGYDIQTTCIFPLPVSRDCSVEVDACSGDCDHGGVTNPLCDGTEQIAAKAYPAPRNIQVVQGMGDRGVLSSICPSNLTTPGSADFGYRSALRSLVERVSPRLGRKSTQ
jgi:hypothetical protein